MRRDGPGAVNVPGGTRMQATVHELASTRSDAASTETQPEMGNLSRLTRTVSAVEQKVSDVIRPISLPLLRFSLGVVFIWFGALKVADATPVTELVANTVPFLDASWFVPVLGIVEVAIGVALIIGRWLTAVCAVLVAHLSGTFLVLVTQPEIAFQGGNPLLLTTIGEFVVKNVVLIAAGLVLASKLLESRTKH
jgi:putative oxidoreductase